MGSAHSAWTRGRVMGATIYQEDMSEASHSENVEIVRRGFGQKFNATDAMAFLAKS